jgi:hypothetical protein
MKQTAHFFWHGTMSLYEYLCIGSFVKHNWDVKVWAYEKLDLPTGATQCDASEILSIDELNTFRVWSPHTKSYESTGGINSGFSDLFRFTLLLKHGGWWFDTDVVCLKDQSQFDALKQNKHIVVGQESKNVINGAVLNFPSKDTNSLILQKCLELCSGTREFGWGAVGPGLITDFSKEQNLSHEAHPQSVFYPIHFYEVDQFFKPELNAQAMRKCKNSYTNHLWNWVLTSKLKIDKNTMPPAGSYLHYVFSNIK